MQDPEKLVVVRRARALTVQVFATTARLRDPDAVAIRGQLRRAVQSIRAQIVEGAYKRSAAEFARFLGIAIASSNEAIVHADDLRSLGFLPKAVAADLLDRINHVRAMAINLRKRVEEQMAYEEDAARSKKRNRHASASDVPRRITRSTSDRPSTADGSPPVTGPVLTPPSLPPSPPA